MAKEDVKEDSWEKEPEAAQDQPESKPETEPESEDKREETEEEQAVAENTDKVLDVLKERNIKTTFFVIGEYVRKHPETARRIVAEGHTIGIHCDVHDYGTLYASVDSCIADNIK